MLPSPFAFNYDRHQLQKYHAGDEAFFALALEQARFCSGLTHPNPAVGAVIVKDGHIVAQGHTHSVGGMHAERHALHQAPREYLAGATLYVTLEPCSHHGRTPPCTDEIIRSGIRRVVYGVADPNHLVAGSGLRALRQAGLVVEEIAQASLRGLSQGHILPFEKYLRQKMPYLIVKVAVSRDGTMGLRGQRSKITGPQADRTVHELRRTVDAVMVGANTVRIDNPLLTARLGDPRHGNQPVRVVMSTNLDLDPGAQIFDTSAAATVAITGSTGNLAKRRSLEQRGVVILEGRTKNGRLDEHHALGLLAGTGITSLLVEPGPTLLASMLAHELADEIWCLRSPMTLGAQGLEAGLDPALLCGYRMAHSVVLGEDILQIWRTSHD